jgi:hypothetical protein
MDTSDDASGTKAVLRPLGLRPPLLVQSGYLGSPAFLAEPQDLRLWSWVRRAGEGAEDPEDREEDPKEELPAMAVAQCAYAEPEKSTT